MDGVLGDVVGGALGAGSICDGYVWGGLVVLLMLGWRGRKRPYLCQIGLFVAVGECGLVVVVVVVAVVVAGSLLVVVVVVGSLLVVVVVVVG